MRARVCACVRPCASGSVGSHVQTEGEQRGQPLVSAGRLSPDKQTPVTASSKASHRDGAEGHARTHTQSGKHLHSVTNISGDKGHKRSTGCTARHGGFGSIFLNSWGTRQILHIHKHTTTTITMPSQAHVPQL